MGKQTKDPVIDDSTFVLARQGTLRGDLAEHEVNQQRGDAIQSPPPKRAKPSLSIVNTNSNPSLGGNDQNPGRRRRMAAVRFRKRLIERRVQRRRMAAQRFRKRFEERGVQRRRAQRRRLMWRAEVQKSRDRNTQ